MKNKLMTREWEKYEGDEVASHLARDPVVKVRQYNQTKG